MVTNVFYQLLSNTTMYAHRCLEDIKILYTSSIKWDYQHQYKPIIKAAILSTPEIFTNSSPKLPVLYGTIINPNAITSLCLFTEVLD